MKTSDQVLRLQRLESEVTQAEEAWARAKLSAKQAKEEFDEAVGILRDEVRDLSQQEFTFTETTEAGA